MANSSKVSDSDSSYSEDEMRVESEIKRHNSEEFIDHGPVLKSLRQQREAELESKAAAKAEKKKEKVEAAQQEQPNEPE